MEAREQYIKQLQAKADIADEFANYGCYVDDLLGIHCILAKANRELQARVETLEAELEQHRWIPVSEGLPNTKKTIEFCWRPIDFLEHPKHIEVVVGTFCYINERGYPIGTPIRVWVSGRYYDIETHITHWRPIISPKENKEWKK